MNTSASVVGKSALLFLAVTLIGVGAVQVRSRVNPIWRVVNLLQNMEKIAEEGKQGVAMYQNFECRLLKHQPGSENECGGASPQDHGNDV